MLNQKLFCALIVGVGEFGDLKNLKRIGIRTLVYTVSVSVVSVFIGIAMVKIFQPGNGIPEESRQQLIAQYADKLKTVSANMALNKERSV